MGEKFDGMRACWNPETTVLYVVVSFSFLLTTNSYSRTATVIPLLPEFKILPPKVFLDGEIW